MAMVPNKARLKAVALCVSLSFFVMGCKSSSPAGSEDTNLTAFRDDGATVTVTVPAPGTATDTDAETCPVVFDFDDETCDDGGGTNTSTLGTQSVPSQGASTLDEVKCTKRYSDCAGKCNEKLSSDHDALVKNIFGTDAALVVTLTTVTLSIKTQLLKACSALSWRQVLTRAGIAAAVITAIIILLDVLIWNAGSITVKKDYKDCITACGDPTK
jgi:hypothetical protein